MAVAAGYEIRKERDDDYGEYDVIDIDWTSYEEKNYYGEWDEDPKDPLIVLFVHSDCEGVIKCRHLEPLYHRLVSILPSFAPADEMAWATLRFLKGLAEAARRGEDVDFH